MIHSSNYWIEHFKNNALKQRVDWRTAPAITDKEIAALLPSLQAWQLAQTSSGSNLLVSATRFAYRTNDPAYVDAVNLYIREEQKHGEALGRYLDSVGQWRISFNPANSLFRRVRSFQNSMEAWTISALMIESTAQVFYQSLKQATNCPLLTQICNDKLIDEVHHINFHAERLAVLYQSRSGFGQLWRKQFYRWFFYGTAAVVWCAHNKPFKAGGCTWLGFVKAMRYKYATVLRTITHAQEEYLWV